MKQALNYSVLNNHQSNLIQPLEANRFGKKNASKEQSAERTSNSQIVIDESLIKKTLRKVAPKVMKYERELNQIRDELGE